MKTRRGRKKCIIYQEKNSYKNAWDIGQSILLIYSCFITPLVLCFSEEIETLAMVIINNIVDLMFLMDMIVIFNTALTTEMYETIDDHKEIACEYLKGWFTIDLIAILPLHWFFR